MHLMISHQISSINLEGVWHPAFGGSIASRITEYRLQITDYESPIGILGQLGFASAYRFTALPFHRVTDTRGAD
jgi:hypothetical protein